MKISVECTIKDESEKSIEPQDIIEKVKNLPREEVAYKSVKFKSQADQDCRELDCIDTAIKAEGNVYFIFDKENFMLGNR